MVDHHREKFGTGSQTAKVILADVTKKSQGKNLNLAKDSENYNLQIVQCFYPELDSTQLLDPNDPKNRIIYSEQRVYEKLDWEFYHNKTGHSGLMGNIRICDLIDNPGSLDDLCWGGALEYSARHRTPIYIDCGKVNLDNYDEIIEQKFRKLVVSADKRNPNIVLWDIFPLAFSRDNV
jgi:hypothetical protein